MRITWHGHSCFELVSGDCTVVIDPYYYRELVGYPPLKLRADAVFCSNENYDHNCREAVELSGQDIGGVFQVEELASFCDVLGGRLRGANTIRIFTAEGLRVAHLGDLGCKLTPEQKQKLHGLDAIMIPVGGILTIDASQARDICDELNPRVILPMHFGGKGLGNRRLAPVEDFTSFYPELTRICPANNLELSAETSKQVLIFSCFEHP